jgi:hypothetical protein
MACVQDLALELSGSLLQLGSLWELALTSLDGGNTGTMVLNSKLIVFMDHPRHGLHLHCHGVYLVEPSMSLADRRKTVEQIRMNWVPRLQNGSSKPDRCQSKASSDTISLWKNTRPDKIDQSF